MTYTSWVDQAACAGMPTHWWFPEPHSDKLHKARALRICGRCPVTAQCLAEAVRLETATQQHGIWGGTTPQDRQTENITIIRRREAETTRRRAARAATKERNTE